MTRKEREQEFETRVRENMYWWARSNWWTRRKYANRITSLAESYDKKLSIDTFKMGYEDLENGETSKHND